MSVPNPQSGTEVGQIVDPEVSLASRLCKRITNTFTGCSWERTLDPRDRWNQLYERAILENRTKPGMFELDMDDAPQSVVEVEGETGKEMRPIYTVMELSRFSKPRLDEIGRLYGVKHSRTQNLILAIMEAQTALYEKTKLEDLPGQRFKRKA